MPRSVSEKMGISKEMRAIFIDGPADAIVQIDPPSKDIKKTLSGQFDYIHFFVTSQAAFIKKFPKLIQYLNKSGMLWVSWPKSGQNKTDLSLTSVIKLGYDYGMVESKCISINSMLSALKFTWPKEGKQYKNSYGKLKA